MMTQRWAVFISGTGSNLQALLDQLTEPFVKVVYSSKKSAVGLSRAARMGVPTVVLTHPVDWTALHQDLVARRIQKIFLLGFMKIIPRDFFLKWEDKIVNLHPSLLPAYPGLHSFEKAFADQAPLGATVHRVNEHVDAGLILKQKGFERLESESETRFRLSWTEQSLVREVFERE